MSSVFPSRYELNPCRLQSLRSGPACTVQSLSSAQPSSAQHSHRISVMPDAFQGPCVISDDSEICVSVRGCHHIHTENRSRIVLATRSFSVQAGAELCLGVDVCVCVCVCV